MPEGTILLIERTNSSEITFGSDLKQKGYTVEVVSSGQAALIHAQALKVVLIILNAASLGSSGMRICKRLRERLLDVPIIHIFAEDTDPSLVKDAAAHSNLVLPFTIRKLVNRIKRYLPSERKDAIEVGAIRLSPAMRIVEAHGKEKRLTPKTASLLEVFLKHPGETLDRGFLMRQVWETDYVGDTRTLDVHVRWVREAVEPEPASPQHIITVRGVGYRFDPNPSMDGTGPSNSSVKEKT
jgi:DNA-binding response OmpR family regulator